MAFVKDGQGFASIESILYRWASSIYRLWSESGKGEKHEAKDKHWIKPGSAGPEPHALPSNSPLLPPYKVDISDFGFVLSVVNQLNNDQLTRQGEQSNTMHYPAIDMRPSDISPDPDRKINCVIHQISLNLR